MAAIYYNTSMEVGFLLTGVGLILVAGLLNKYDEHVVNKNVKIKHCNLIKEPHKWLVKSDSAGENPYMICEKCELMPNLIEDNNE